MLISPLPGVDRRHVRSALESVATVVGNLRSAGPHTAQERLHAYLEWANEAAFQLARIITPRDIDRLVLTQRHAMLLAGVSHFRYPDETRLVNSLVSVELDQRVEAFDQAVQTLRTQIDTWTRQGVFVVADTSFYIQHPVKLIDADLAEPCAAREEPIHLLLPMVVIDELDNLKESKNQHVRWRAGHTLGVVDGAFGPDPRQPAVLHPRHNTEPGSQYLTRGEVTMELLFDPPRHVRLPSNDDEIIDRALAAQTLAGQHVLFLTYDTGQSTRARAAGLKVKKLTRDPGPEPEATK